MTGEEPARAREVLTDEEIIAMARKVSKELRGRRGDFDKFAGWLMLRVISLPPAAPEDDPEAIVRAWCKGCRAATPSVPCPKCGGPACAGCGRCPPCDGDIPEGSNG